MKTTGAERSSLMRGMGLELPELKPLPLKVLQTWFLVWLGIVTLPPILIEIVQLIKGIRDPGPGISHLVPFRSCTVRDAQWNLGPTSMTLWNGNACKQSPSSTDLMVTIPANCLQIPHMQQRRRLRYLTIIMMQIDSVVDIKHELTKPPFVDCYLPWLDRYNSFN